MQRLTDVLTRKVSRHLRQQRDTLPHSRRSQPSADDSFRRMHLIRDFALVVDAEAPPVLPRLSAAVRFGCIEQSDASLDGIVHDAEGGLLRNLAPESGAAEPDAAGANPRFA